MRHFIQALVKIGRIPFLFAIKVYQKTLSLDHGPLRRFFPQGYCRFYPSCSQYGYRSIENHGVFKGSIMAFYRILRCNPWSKGGIDEVPLAKINVKKEM